MSWALSRCPEFLKAVVSTITGRTVDPDEVVVRNQAYDAKTGITDIEVTDGKSVHIIFEAKRGWDLPGEDQLTRYSLRSDFQNGPAASKHIVSMSECTKEYADLYLPFQPPRYINGIPISHLPYAEVYHLALSAIALSNHEQKHLLTHFTEYLQGLMSMQKKDSNMVYVVALGTDKPAGCDITWIDIVQKHICFFCPLEAMVGPKNLRINCVQILWSATVYPSYRMRYTVTRNLHDEITEMPDEVWATIAHFIILGGNSPRQDRKNRQNLS
jgi:hypothetical protein